MIVVVIVMMRWSGAIATTSGTDTYIKICCQKNQKVHWPGIEPVDACRGQNYTMGRDRTDDRSGVNSSLYR